MVKAIITFEATDVTGLQAALSKAGGMLEGAKGFHGIELHRGVEMPQRLLLFADWDAVTDHMAWMKVNEKSFLDAVTPFLSGPPDIKHYQ